MKKLIDCGIDAQDLSNYALALQGKDNSVDCYSLASRLECLESAAQMLIRSCHKSGIADDLSEKLPLARNVRNVAELVKAGEEIAAWLTAITGATMDQLIGCWPDAVGIKDADDDAEKCSMIIQSAKRHAGTSDQADLCARDAEQLAKAGAFKEAAARAVWSLQFSLGEFSDIQKNALTLSLSITK